ncbi:MAG: matrixin family metalloprotease [Nitrosopumilaceae archaeon]|nr:matrixin family metalloprotease [Nitrosopumilaceae archaeon]
MLPIPIPFLVLAAGMLAVLPAQPALGQADGTELYVYIEELPDWASYASNVMYESTRYWEEQIPGLQFYVADDPSRADFRVQWVKEFGVEHVGYAYGSKFIEVGLGDSNCLDQWNPFSANYVSHIMTHEIGHVLGYQHSDDPGNIMYPLALNHEYGIIEHDLSFVENYGYYLPVCSSKQVTSFNFQVSTDDPVYGFDVYFVPGPDSLDQWSESQPFEHYADDSCLGKNYLQFASTCEGVAGDSGLLIVTHDVQSNPLTTITVRLQEVSEARTHAVSQSFPTKLADSGTPSMADSYNLFVDPQRRYTIQYPSTWIVDDEVSEAHQASFYDHENWAAAITVLLFDGDYAGYSDDEILDAIIEYERDFCSGQTYSIDRQICYDFDVISRDVYTQESGRDVYAVAYESTRQYYDPSISGEYPTVTIVAELHDGSNMWNVVADSDVSAFELYSELLVNSIASFQITSASKHQAGQTGLIPVPQEPDPGLEAPSPSTRIGNVGVDQDVYVVGPSAIATYAKISGTAGETNRGDKIAITYTYPDGTTSGNLVYPTKDGYFEALLSLDRDSPRGTYEVFASLNNRMLGIVTFEVTDRQPEPVPPPPVIAKDSDEDKVGVDTEIPTIVREEEDDVGDDNASAPPPVVDAQPVAVAEPATSQASMPEWVKISAGWWAEDALDDGAFLQSIQYLINQGIIQIPTTEAGGDEGTGKIPTWVRTSAGWWAEGAIDDDTFVRSIQFLVQNGVIVVAESE